MDVHEARPELPNQLGDIVAPPRVAPPLDHGFRPISLARRELSRAIAASGRGVPVSIAVEMPGRSVCTRQTSVFEEGHPAAPATTRPSNG